MKTILKAIGYSLIFTLGIGLVLGYTFVIVGGCITLADKVIIPMYPEYGDLIMGISLALAIGLMAGIPIAIADSIPSRPKRNKRKV